MYFHYFNYSKINICYLIEYQDYMIFLKIIINVSLFKIGVGIKMQCVENQYIIWFYHCSYLC